MQGYFFSKPVPTAQLFTIYHTLNHRFSEVGEYSINDYLPQEAYPEDT
jgi:hypothetical protein